MVPPQLLVPLAPTVILQANSHPEVVSAVLLVHTALEAPRYFLVLQGRTVAPQMLRLNQHAICVSQVPIVVFYGPHLSTRASLASKEVTAMLVAHHHALHAGQEPMGVLMELPQILLVWAVRVVPTARRELRPV